jgi:predicted glycosyltransferase
MVLGPHFPNERAASVTRKAAGKRIHVLRSPQYLLPLMRAAHAVVAMAGYNTTMELLRSKTPALVVPRSGPSAEQGMRARCFGERNWVRVIPPPQMGTTAFAEGVVSVLQQSIDSAVGAPCLNGAKHAARNLLHKMNSHARL